MEARELRIGNKISYYNKIYDVVQIGLNGVLATSIKGQCSAIITHPMLKPISLTDEWLLKFGFVHDKEGEIYNRYDICLSYSEYYDGFKLYVNHEYEIGIEIKYVHELQNLYFALTGNELEIKM